MTKEAHNRDSYAWGNNFLSRIDPRVKMASAAALLALNLVTPSFLAALLISLAIIGVMVAGNIPYRRQLVMIAFPLTFALFVIVSQTLFEGKEILGSVGPFDLHRDGLCHGLFLSLRIVAGGLVVVLLGVTTPLNRLCLALRWFRVPVTFVEVVQLTYRYLHDIHAELSRMKDAQRARLGWKSTGTGLASSRMLAGALFLHVYERGVRSAEAMRCRGAGPVLGGTLPRLGRLDLVAVITTALMICLLVLLSLEAGR